MLPVAIVSIHRYGAGMVVTMTAEAIARVERRAAEDPGFAGALLELVDAPSTTAGSYSHSAARALNRPRRDHARERFLEGCLVTSDVQRLLHLQTPQAVHRLHSRGKLIGRQIGNATWFPAWQFRGGERRPDLDEVLAKLRRCTSDAMAADRIMRLQRDELGGQSIAETLDRPRKKATAWAILESLG
jgi:hypothetical protein